MKEEKIENEISISITPFQSEILGANESNIFLKEIYFTGEDSIDNPCVIQISKSLFNKICKLYIARKTEYCLKYNEFCGVFGDFHIEAFKQIGEIDLLTGFDETKGDDGELIYSKVPLFRVSKISLICDMEHG